MKYLSKEVEGAPLPGVNVTVTGPAISRSMVTDSKGMFRFAALPPGTYSVSAILAGFKKQTETGIVLMLEQTRRVDLSLEVGQIEEEITVIGISPIVDLTSSRMTTNVKKEFFDALPKGRSYQDMVQLAPSVQGDPWGASMSGATKKSRSKPAATSLGSAAPWAAPSNTLGFSGMTGSSTS